MGRCVRPKARLAQKCIIELDLRLPLSLAQMVISFAVVVKIYNTNPDTLRSKCIPLGNSWSCKSGSYSFSDRPAKNAFKVGVWWLGLHSRTSQDILQVQKIFVVQHSSLSLYPLFLKNPLAPFIPTLFDPVPRLNRPRDIVQALHNSLHFQNLMLEVAYRSSLVGFRGQGEFLPERNRFLKEFAG
jgi:hypothetical protein